MSGDLLCSLLHCFPSLSIQSICTSLCILHSLFPHLVLSCLYHSLTSTYFLSPSLCLTIIYFDNNHYNEIPGPPEEVHNCSVRNQSLNQLLFSCQPGDNGGLRQVFFLEVYHHQDSSSASSASSLSSSTSSLSSFIFNPDPETSRIYANLSSVDVPEFFVQNLPPGTKFTFNIYAVNSKGRSPSVSFTTSTLSPPEKQTKIYDITDGKTSIHSVKVFFTDTLPAWIVSSLLILLLVLLLLMAKRRASSPCFSRNSHKRVGENHEDARDEDPVDSVSMSSYFSKKDCLKKRQTEDQGLHRLENHELNHPDDEDDDPNRKEYTYLTENDSVLLNLHPMSGMRLCQPCDLTCTSITPYNYPDCDVFQDNLHRDPGSNAHHHQHHACSTCSLSSSTSTLPSTLPVYPLNENLKLEPGVLSFHHQFQQIPSQQQQLASLSYQHVVHPLQVPCQSASPSSSVGSGLPPSSHIVVSNHTVISSSLFDVLSLSLFPCCPRFQFKFQSDM